LDLSYISKAFGLTLDKAELIVAAFTRYATRSARDSHQRRFFPDVIAFDGNRFNRTAVTTPLFEYLARATSVGVSRSGSGAPARNHHGPEPQWSQTFSGKFLRQLDSLRGVAWSNADERLTPKIIGRNIAIYRYISQTACSTHITTKGFRSEWDSAGTAASAGNAWCAAISIFIILEIIKERPRHGYDVIKAIEEKFHGFYSPSAGSVYPILQELADHDFVRGSEESGKKTYSITKEGERELKASKDKFLDMREHLRHRFRDMGRYSELMREIGYIRISCVHKLRERGTSDTETIRKLRIAIVNFKSEVEEILREQKRD
jgi:DNA-binding PadR family transcriptional regulator